eukprot:scaffold124123_cov30-Tisochrysis_lutea.AAC.2
MQQISWSVATLLPDVIPEPAMYINDHVAALMANARVSICAQESRTQMSYGNHSDRARNQVVIGMSLVVYLPPPIPMPSLFPHRRVL